MKIFKYSIGILLGLIFLYFAFQGINFDDLFSALKNANYFWIFLYFCVALFSHFIRAWRWKYLIDHIKEDVGLRNLFSSVMIGYMVNNFISRGGELARPYALGKLEHISVSSSLATVIVERILDVLTLIIIILFSLLFYKDLLLLNFPWLNFAVTIAIVLSILGILFLIFLSLKTEMMIKIIKNFFSFLPHKILDKIESFLKSLLEGFNIIKDAKKYFYIISLTVFLWFLYSLQYYVAFFSFNIGDIYSMSFSSAILLNTILAIGIMIPVPGYVGTYHAFCIQALTGLFFVDQPSAAAYATMTHAVGVIGITAFGLYFFLKDNIKLSNISKPNNTLGIK